MHAEDLLPWKVIDAIIPEPLGGAHRDAQAVYDAVQTFVLQQWDRLKSVPASVLLMRRYKKFRNMGKLQCVVQS